MSHDDLTSYFIPIFSYNLKLKLLLQKGFLFQRGLIHGLI